tara:strand:- start:291 stop:1310 length:1020 start_codon:yes stop_codon:yes gene_type:complete
MAKNILKEAIADAKAVREVALANAKAALEEAFTPKLQNMLSAKLSEELDEEGVYYEDEEDLDLDVDEDFNEDSYEEETYEEGEIVDDSEVDMDEEIDLEDILNELEVEEDEAEEELEEHGGLNQETPYYTADTMHKVTASEKNIYEGEEFDLESLLKEINNLEKEEELDEELDLDIEDDEDVELEEMVKETKTGGCGCGAVEAQSRSLTMELNETRTALNTVKSELNEVNLLNSKLLYVNRIFKANNLDEGQKLRVVETLDKAESIKEAKLIYETIKDTFNVANTKKASAKSKTKSLREGIGMASRATGTSTAPKKEIISESTNMVNRFQKLANIKINQ